MPLIPPSAGRLGRRDRGSATLEMAIATPVMLLLISLMVLAGRVAVASNTVTTVAGNAAREASLARTAGASAVATSSARAALVAQAINCRGGGHVAVDVSGFGAAARGVPGQVVAVSIVCEVSISDLGLPGAPGTRTLSEQGVSPIDPNRSAGAP